MRDFDNEVLNDEFINVPLFHGQKIYTVSNFRQKIVEMKKAQLSSIVFWKRKFNFTVGKKHMAVELQVYPGDKTSSTSVEDTAQYLPYKYNPFKDESEG